MAAKKTVKKETAAKTAPVKAAAKAAPKAAKAAPKAAPKTAKSAPVKSNDPEENIKRFAKTALAMNFVKAHNGAWNHTDWLEFCAYLEENGYTPIDLDRVGLLLEQKKSEFFEHR